MKSYRDDNIDFQQPVKVLTLDTRKAVIVVEAEKSLARKIYIGE